MYCHLSPKKLKPVSGVVSRPRFYFLTFCFSDKYLEKFTNEECLEKVRFFLYRLNGRFSCDLDFRGCRLHAHAVICCHDIPVNSWKYGALSVTPLREEFSPSEFLGGSKKC